MTAISISSSPAREFAVEVVRRLRTAGFEALWAGGCVRDQLLGRTPKDFDVATNATPDQIREVFGKRRTLAIGAAFGVMTVVGRKEQGQVEVATFRRDAGYSDGRHPDAVTFSTAEEDAQRRDFTINGLFYDPVDERVLDFVGGQDDLKRGLIRAIGSPFQRFDEDKLRMLRAVRFTATFDFQLDPATLAAIQQQAATLALVSAERIAAEMRRMLVHANRARAVELLRESRLLAEILPELLPHATRPEWSQQQETLRLLGGPTFATSLAALLQPLGARSAEEVGRRWKLANDEISTAEWLLRHEPDIRRATRLPWPKLQRILVGGPTAELLALCMALASVYDGDTSEIEFCRAKLALPPDQLNPAPLLTGDDLKTLGLPPGPLYKRLLAAIRDGQLEQRLRTREEAIALARTMSGS